MFILFQTLVKEISSLRDQLRMLQEATSVFVDRSGQSKVSMAVARKVQSSKSVWSRREEPNLSESSLAGGL